jgi:LDH2 family malate/lactate/ureidoglycolate dehydrogenase
MSDNDYARVPWRELQRVSALLFEARGLSAEDAELVATHLVRANARGVHSHGLIRLDFYLPKLDAGTLEPRTRLTLQRETPVFKHYSGNNGIGQVIAARAMHEAVAISQRLGLGAVLVRNSNHFGIAQLHTLLAAERGQIGVVMSNASPALAPTGGAEKLIGNNPWSVAAPSAGEFPVIIDMANTVVARGKILTARAEGRQIPLGWALDASGNPTTDPEEALAGMVLPMAGHKGYAISLAVDLLTGVLGGAGWLDAVSYPGNPGTIGNVTQLYLALDPSQLAPGDYQERVHDAVSRIKQVRKTPETEEVFLPGEMEHRREQASHEQGVPLSVEVLGIVERHAKESGIEWHW